MLLLGTITDSLTAPAKEAAPIGYYLSPVSLAPAAQGRWHVRHACPNILLVEELEDGGNGRSTPPTSEGRVPRAIWPAAQSPLGGGAGAVGTYLGRPKRCASRRIVSK